MESDDAEACCRAIARNPALKAEVAEVAPRLAEWARPASAEAIMRKLVELAPVYGIGDRSEAEWASLFSAYLDALAPLPMESINTAAVLWNRQASYFPKPGELFKLAEANANRLRSVAWRARRAAEYVDALPPPPPTDAERAQVAAMMADLRKELAAKRNGFHTTIPKPSRERYEVAEELRSMAEAGPTEDEEAIT